MENKKGISRGVLISIIVIIVVVVAIVGLAFIVFFNKPEVIQQETLEGGSITLTYSDEENLFVMENGVPTTDAVGMKFDSADKYFDFTVKTVVDDAEYIEYQIVLVKDEKASSALDSNIKVYLEKEDSGTYTKVGDPVIFVSEGEANKDSDEDVSKAIYKIKKTSNDNDNYRLRMWIDENAEVTSDVIQNYGVKVTIKGEAK